MLPDDPSLQLSNHASIADDSVMVSNFKLSTRVFLFSFVAKSCLKYEGCNEGIFLLLSYVFLDEVYW